MRWIPPTLLSLLLVGQASLVAAPYNLGSSSSRLEVNNRVLLKLGEKMVTVVDLKRKMDLMMYRNYPAAAATDAFKYQFYLANWEHVFNATIDELLILADAEEKKVKVTQGDIREELEKLFGPDVVLNLQKAGLRKKEAWEMLEKELICQKLLGPMVHARALSDVPPQKVRKAYEAYLAANPPEASWTYRVVTIRGGTEKQRKTVSEAALALLQEQKIPFEKIASELEERKITPSAVFVKVSDEYNRQDSEISLAHKAILQTLAVGAMSSAQKGSLHKATGEELCRLFFLKERIEAAAPPFNELNKKLKGELMRIAVEKRSKQYLSSLREKFGIDPDYLQTTLSKDFVPFSLH